MGSYPQSIHSELAKSSYTLAIRSYLHVTLLAPYTLIIIIYPRLVQQSHQALVSLTAYLACVACIQSGHDITVGGCYQIRPLGKHHNRRRWMFKGLNQGRMSVRFTGPTR